MCEQRLVNATLGKMRKTGRAANLINSGVGDDHIQQHLGMEGCESVGWAPWEGWRCLRRAGTEGKERKALRKGGDNHRSHLLPLLFSVLC